MLYSYNKARGKKMLRKWQEKENTVLYPIYRKKSVSGPMQLKPVLFKGQL